MFAIELDLFLIQFAKQDFHGLPEFIRSVMSEVVFPLLAHPQLPVRENTIKAFCSYLARCDFQVKKYLS